jgi:hypothetical protein
MPWQNETDLREEHHQSNLDLVRNRHGDLAGFDKLELYAQGVANRSQANYSHPSAERLMREPGK